MIDRDLLVELRKTCTIGEIAEKLGVSKTTVGRYVTQYGLGKPANRIDIHDNDILSLWNQGFTIIEIADRFDCSHDTITKRLKKYNILCDRVSGIKRHFDRTHEELWSEIKVEFDCKKSFSYICKKYKIRPDCLKRLMSQHDYVLNGIKSCVDSIDERVRKCCDDKELLYLNALLNYYDVYHSVPSIHGLADSMGISYYTVVNALKKYELYPFIKTEKMSSFVSRLVGDLDLLSIPYELNNRSILKTNKGTFLEMDVYLPDVAIGIEVNPVSTHSCDIEPFGISDKMYHQKKSLLAEQYGVSLIHMYDFDFVNEDQYHKILMFIKYCYCSKCRIGARNCVIKDIRIEDVNAFLRQYHFQGVGPATSWHYGLFYNDVLVSVLCIGKSRFTSDDYEIVRYCVHPEYAVIGGFNRLFSNFIGNLDHGCTIVSYMDLNKRFSVENIYEKSGFVLDKITQPDYVWVDKYGTNILRRYQTTKARLFAEGYSRDKTEVEIMRSRGFYRVFGAGSKRYVFTV